ncbi:MAG TPA: amino acid adenylation domain-containing protein, partial [Thermoanaerobaculia bacterium]|nr:amino acid adenylation domain-containing protein [Thermoanaerobaculia bacterium]
MSESLREKKARLRSLLEKPREETFVPRVEPRRQRPGLEPLSFAQKSLWFVSKLEGLNPAHNIPILLRFAGRLDVETLSRAVSALVRRHEALRTHFVEQGGVPFQVLSEPADVRLEPEMVAPEEAEAAYSAVAQDPFDVAGDHLFRVRLFAAASDRFALVVTMHHSVSDAWSAGLFLRELTALYTAYSQGRNPLLEPLAVTYVDYVHWEKEWLESGVLERQLAYWRRQLADLPPLLDLPADRPLPAIPSNHGGTAHFHVPPELLERLKGLGTEQKSTLFLTLRAVLAVLLHRYSTQEDFAIGTGVDNRRRPELEGLIGYFVNLLAIRVQVAGEQSFAAVLKAGRAAVLEALANQDVPFQRVLEELRPERATGGQQRPLFQVLFILQNVPYQRRVELPELLIEAEVPDSGAAKFDLSVAVQEDAGRLLGQIEYRSDLFDAPTVERLAGHYVRLLREAVAHPERRACEMGLLDAAEQHQILLEWNDAGGAAEPGLAGAAEERRLLDLNRAGRTWARPVAVHDLFTQQAGRTPEAAAAAAVGPRGTMTYRELAERSTALARLIRRLLSKAGIDQRVGLLADPDPQVLVGMLGILKAGCGFVPMDPRFPGDRLTWMLEDCACEVLVTQRQHLERTAELARDAARPLHVLCLDDLDGEATDLRGPRAPGSLAYVVYTSGSTGRPKGVEISHENLVPMLLWGCDYLGLGEESRVLQSLSFCFDFGIFEQLTTVLAGGTLYFPGKAPGEAAGDPAAFAREIARRGINTLHTTPAFARELAAAATGGTLEGLEIVHLGGEALARSTVARIREAAPRAVVYNGYGPTEVTVNSAIFRIDDRIGGETGGAVVPIGRRSADNALYVVDPAGRLVPWGASGELVVGGIGVARGYLHRPDLTAERFVPDPFGEVPGGRLYRTGDLVRYLPEGDVEFLGRIDEQVKIRGFRVEPGEIEAVLREHPRVREAAVLARPEPSGDRRLVAYVAGDQVAAPELRAFLAHRLPPHMVPSIFMALAALPLTPNGKLDRRALPAPGGVGEAPRRERFGRPAPGARAYVLDKHRAPMPIGGPGELWISGAGEAGARLQSTGDRARYLANGEIELVGRVGSSVEILSEAGEDRPADYVAPRTDLERRLCEIWAEVLGAERVGIEDDFFDLGGHSLLAMRAVSLMRAALERELPLRALFENPTVAGLCARLAELSGDQVLPPIEVLPDRENLPLSYAQQRLWFIDRLEGGSSHYNISGWARVLGPLDSEAFAAAIRTIVARHEALRTVFREVDGGVVQVIRTDVDVPLALNDLSGLDAAEREREVQRLALEDARKPFDLSRDLLLRVGLLKLAADEHAVLFSMHHIASDGWSAGVLMRELRALYVKSPLPTLPVQYADYASWQRQWLRGEVLGDQLSYWRGQLAGLPLVHSLPLDRPRPARQGFAGSEHVQRLPRELRERIEASCRASGVTFFMFLQAAFAVLLSRCSHETDVVVGSPIAGRVHQDVEPLIGCFVNTLVLRSDLSGNPRFVELLEVGKQTVLSAYAHQHVPFEMLVEELRPERSLSVSPLFQILLVLQNMEQGEVGRLGDARLEWRQEASGVVKLDLELNVWEVEDGLDLHWFSKKELFDGATIERLAACFEVLLAGIVERPEERIEALPLLTKVDRTQLQAWNDTRAAYPAGSCLHELIEAQVERAPERTALAYRERSLSYRELDAAADRLARQLTGPESIVGVLAERSLEMVVGLLAVLKAGGAYLPLDPDYPAERLAFMLADSGARVVLAQERLLSKLPVKAEWLVPLDGAADPGDAATPTARPASGASPGNLAYAIYTSGSTGRPKGTLNSHQGIVNRLLWMQERYGLTGDDRVLQKTPYSFDVSVWELFWPLLTGARLVIAEPGGHQDPAYLIATIEAAGITTIHFVPSMLQAFLEAPGVERCAASLVRVVCSGEALPPEMTRRFFARLPGVELHNLYGPTEAAVDVTFWACDPADRRGLVPIG